uniref:Uncharacterized protein n=1 Tax=Oryza sativa subsp. japonica TaxID=39947 RepID=Q7F1E5_ORYSJ|nr:hypothetical protein [Oryza sativa Japonica Group]BAD11571.1 hypothetical protein [Oryza sativa Japonica Group]
MRSCERDKVVVVLVNGGAMCGDGTGRRRRLVREEVEGVRWASGEEAAAGLRLRWGGGHEDVAALNGELLDVGVSREPGNDSWRMAH